MGLDALSPVAPARIRCLVLPCGRITRSRFLLFVERLQQETVVRLGDVSPNAGPLRHMFSPMAFPTGLAVYDISTTEPSPAQLALTPFELYREPLVILGVADALEYFHVGTTSAHEFSAIPDGAVEEKSSSAGAVELDDLVKSVDWLKEKYPSALIHQVFVLDWDKSISLIPNTGLVPVPSVKKSTTTTMKTVMCDLSSILLGEMTSYAMSLQALPNIETPKPLHNERPFFDRSSSGIETDGFPRPESRISSTSGSRSVSPPGDAESKRPRASVQSHPRTGDDLEARSRSNADYNGQESPPTSFDQINGLSGGLPTLGDNDKTKQLSKDRIPLPGFGSGSVGERARNKAKGRIGVILGSMYLLAGRWPDAVKELVESATVARATSDHVWHAKALDYILVSLLMCAWAGMDFEIPQICYPLGDKSSPGISKSFKHTSSTGTPDLPPLKSPNAANRLVSLQNLCHLLPDLVNNILHLYVRAATFTADQLPQVAYSESTIRFSKLLAVIEESHGTLDDQGLHSIVLNVDSSARTSLVPSQLASVPSKSEIAAILFRALPSVAMEQLLNINDRINILAGISSVLAKLGLHRKKAMILRELMLILLPALIQSRKDSAAELGVHPAASLSSFDFVGSGVVHEDTVGGYYTPDAGIQMLLRSVCEVHGMVLSTPHGIYKADKVLLGDPASLPLAIEQVESKNTEVAALCALQCAAIRSFGNLSLKVDVLRSCINICEALPDLEGVLRFSGDLLRAVGSGIAPGSGGGGSPALSIEDQSRLVNSISRIAGAAKKLSLERPEAQYWDEFLIRGIEIFKASSLMCPVSRDKSQLNSADLHGSETKEGPFIYNPFLTKPSSAGPEPLLITNEEAIFNILCQNLYDIDVEIEWIKLDAPGTMIGSLSKNIVIGPYSTHSVHVSGTPRTSGLLRINGCVVKIRGCLERRFPLFNSQWSGAHEPKIKWMGLAPTAMSETAAPVLDETLSQLLPSAKSPVAVEFHVNVIEAQPNVIIKNTSLSQSAIMLLEGETETFSLTLQNVSSTTPVDLLLVSFGDSTSDLLRSALANKDLSPAELYEVELASYRKEAIKWRRQSGDLDSKIMPLEELTLEIEVLGKPGLTHGAVHVDYGYLGVPRSQVLKNFYTRQVIFPFTVTVIASVDLIRNDLLPFTGDFAWSNKQREQQGYADAQATSSNKRPRAVSRLLTKTENRFQSLLERLGLGTQGLDHCLLLLDFYNAWLNPLSISLQVREMTTLQDPISSDLWKRAYTVHEVIQPGHTSRLVLLLPRISLSNPLAPIPSLDPGTKRQFVFSSNKSDDPEAERYSREAFWLREEVLKLLRATWTEDISGRMGDVELRALRLTSRMIDSMRLEEMGIELAVASDSTSEPDSHSITAIAQISRTTYVVPVDRFIVLTTTITNRLPHAIVPLLRLQPFLKNQPYNIALDLGRKFAFNGLMQQALPLLKAGESREVRVAMVWLCKGEFEIRASVEEVRIYKHATEGLDSSGENSSAPTQPAEVGMEEMMERVERMVWHCREACVIHVVDTRDNGN